MPRYIRSKSKGATYFFTVNTHQRQPILTQPINVEAIRLAIQKTKQCLPFKIDAWVVMPDHMHAIWTLPDNDHDYSKRWGIFKMSVSKTCKSHGFFQDKTQSQLKRNESGLWQRRFWEHEIRDENDYKTHMDYLHWNPVKHGLTSNVCDWPYSSFHKLVDKGVYEKSWGCNDKAFGLGKFGE